MGDCRLRIQISRELIDTESALSNNNRNNWYTISKICSADTTIREVVEEITVDSSSSSSSPPLRFALLPLLQANRVCLWDCTIHPPVDISDWPISIYTEKGGPNSKTLFDAKWYPSGSLQVVPAGQGPQTASAGHYDDSQYNLPSDSVQPATQQQQQARVQLVSATPNSTTAVTATTNNMLHGLPAPSQVLHAVTKRFDDGDGNNEAESAAADQAAAVQIRRQNQQAVAARQTDRFLKLEQRIRSLQEASSSSGGKNKKVSDQVRSMLIKSRATGRSDLKMQDRVFLHGMIDQGEATMREGYRYFSLQDTVGRVLSTFANKTETGKDAELLIRRLPKAHASVMNENENNETAVVYRRLPTLMRLYEAISQQHLADIDTVVIRLYNSAQEEATPSVVDDKEDIQPDMMDTETTTVTTDNVPPDMMDTQTTTAPENNAPEEKSTHDAEEVTNDRLTDAIRNMDEGKDPKKKKKKSSAATTKVRQMQMKSRATGDAKQVKMEDRFFLELVIVTDEASGDQCTATAAPLFVSQTNNFERLVRDHGKAPTASQQWQWEILVPVSDDAENSSYRRITDSQMSFQDAQKSKTVNPFDRLILQYFQQ
jgi:hypothetical protein